MGLRWEKSNQKKKGRFSKGILIFILMFLLIFTLFNVWMFYKTGYEPSTLITCVFGFCGAEGGYLAFVKKVKEIDKRKDDE